MATVKVQKGQTLSSIAKANNTTVSALAKANNIKDVNKIYAGQSLTIGGGSGVSSGSAPAAGGTAAFTGSNLKIGSTGDSVKALQSALGITADGIYGPQTQAAVKAYQAKNGLAVDGIAGQQTFGALGNITIPKANQTVTAGGAIAADGLLGNTGKLNLPTFPGLTNDPKAFASSIPEVKVPETPLEQNYKRMTSLVDQLTGQDKYAKSLEKQYDLPENVKRLQEVNMQIAQAKNEFAAMSNIAGNKAIPMPFIVGEQTQIENTKAIQLGALAATAQAIQGNIDMANQLIDRAIQIKFEPVEKELTYRMNLYEQLKDDMTASEKLTVQNNLSKDGAKYNAYLEAMDYAMKAVAANAPDNEKASIMSNIAKARTAEEVYLAAGKYAADPDLKDAGALTPAQINSSVNQIAGAFDNEPIVKAFNTVAEGYQTLQDIGVDTTSPADDIAFIYGFAKIMDPNSVVREGEYNTIQKYAQTWADNFGFSAKRIFSNTNFLTPDAKQKMLNALKPKVDSITTQYTSLRNDYQKQIDEVASGGTRRITDYAAGVPSVTGGESGSTVKVQTKVGELDLSTWGN